MMFFLVAKSNDVLIVSVVGGGGVKTVINVLAGHVGKHKPASSSLCLECLLTTKMKTVLTSIQLVCITKPSWRHLGAIKARLGPVGGGLHKF